MMTFLSGSRETVIPIIFALYDQHKENTVNYLKPYWLDWLARGYNKTNIKWLDWAIAGEIPLTKEQKKQNKWDQEWAALQRDTGEDTDGHG